MRSSSRLLVKSRGAEPGLHRIAGPGDAGLRFLEFFILQLGPGFISYSGTTGDREFTLDLIDPVPPLKKIKVHGSPPAIRSCIARTLGATAGSSQLSVMYSG